MRTLTVVMAVIIACTLVVPASASISLAGVSHQGDVHLRDGEIMAVVELVHPGYPKANRFAVITPNAAPVLHVYREPMVVINLKVTASTTNWKVCKVQNSADPSWSVTLNRDNMGHARDAGDWMWIQLTSEDLVRGVPNVFTIRLEDDGSHKKGPLGIGRFGIRNSNLLTFTLAVTDSDQYPFSLDGNNFHADPTLSATSREAFLIKSEEGGWLPQAPIWYDRAVRSSIRIRANVPVASAMPVLASGAKNAAPPAPAAPQRVVRAKPLSAQVVRDHPHISWEIRGTTLYANAQFLKRARFEIQNADGTWTPIDRDSSGGYINSMNFSRWTPGTSTNVRVSVWKQAGKYPGSLELRITRGG